MWHPDMSDPGKGAKGGKSETKEVDHKDLPLDAEELRRVQAAEQINAWRQMVGHMETVLVRGGGGGGDSSDPDGRGGDGDPKSSSDTDFDDDGNPIEKGPAFFARQKKKHCKYMKRINPPIFKGEPGEWPEAHLLQTLDWFESTGLVSDWSKMKNFRHTLDSTAHEWFHDLWSKERNTLKWAELENRFFRYFSTQGRSLRHLHAAWRRFTFNPETDDI